MDALTLRDRGPRVYVLGSCYNIRSSLKDIGAHWDQERNQWWIGNAKRDALEACIKGAGVHFRYVPEGVPFRGMETACIGSAMHHDELHYVIWAGMKEGRPMKKIVARDASKEHWVNDAEAPWVKQYKVPKTIRELQAYAEMMQNQKGSKCPRCGPSPSTSCPICSGICSPKVPLFLDVYNFAAQMDAPRISGVRLGRPWPEVVEVKGIESNGDFRTIPVQRVNFDIRNLSKNGKWGVRLFYSLTGGRVYHAREHVNYSKDRHFFVHATPTGEAKEVEESWVRQALSAECLA